MVSRIAARDAARTAPIVRVNPPVSRLGFRAYDRRSFYVHDDPADPKGYRGPTEFWLQPPRALLDEVADPRLGFQVYGGLILPATERGHHHHTHPRAFDFFYLMAGPFLVALENLAGDEQEVYGFAGPAVLVFPPFRPHVVRNAGAAAAPFVAYKSWNYAEAGALTEPHAIAVDPRAAARALARPLALPDGRFGFGVGERPTSQGADGRPAVPGRAA
jgi:hypothetical protein